MFKELEKKGYKEGDIIFEVLMSTQVMDFTVRHSIYYLKELEQNLEDNVEKLIVHPNLANSLFLTIYGEFERLLHDLCNAYRDELKLSLSVDDLKNKGILRSINYLSKVVSIPNIKSGDHYDLITHWNRIRNLIAHDIGIISEEKHKKSIERLNLNLSTVIDNEFRVWLSIDDCERFYGTMFEYLYLLIKDKEKI